MARQNWLSFAAAALMGCSSGGPDPSATANTPASSASASKTAPSTVAASAAPAVTSTERSFDQYRAPGHDELAWAGLYFAVADTPADYKAVAARFDPTFQNTSDAFARQDAVARVKTKLDQAIAEAKSKPFVQLPPVRMHMPPYDLAHGRYDLGSLIGPDLRVRVADGAASITFAANPGLADYAPATETEARRLEHTIASNPLGRSVEVVVYGKVVGASLRGGEPQLTLVPTRVAVQNALADGSTQPLFVATTVP
ncbi:hypothetical protein P3W23_09130 [Luteibacter sp. PPL554]